MDSTNERRPIPGYEGRYEIDISGQVYALFPFKGLPAGRKIGSRPDALGYVKTWLTKDKQTKQVSVHRLLMLTFRPVENSRELEVNHIDGNTGNNSLDNLEWVTHRDNIQHARKVLKGWSQHRGESIGGSKFNPDIVREIRRLHADGKTNLQIARLYNVSTMAIWKIVQGRSWAHVE